MEYTDEYIVKKEDLIAIAEPIREKTNTTDLITVEQMPGKINEVYEAGFEAGKAQGGGGNTEQILDEFASTIQRVGTRTDFSNAFLRSTITDETISGIFARWNSTIQRANKMFSETANLREGLYTDVLDFSQCVNLLDVFSESGITKLKKIDARATTSGFNGMANMFYNCRKLESIDEFYPSVNTKFSGTFSTCYGLTKIIFMSEIAVDGLAISHCSKINKESLMSILNQLKDYTGTGTTKTVTLGTTNLAKLTDAEKAIATQKGWTLT